MAMTYLMVLLGEVERKMKISVRIPGKSARTPAGYVPNALHRYVLYKSNVNARSRDCNRSILPKSSKFSG
jgi:hypothetical protein